MKLGAASPSEQAKNDHNDDDEKPGVEPAARAEEVPLLVERLLDRGIPVLPARRVSYGVTMFSGRRLT